MDECGDLGLERRWGGRWRGGWGGQDGQDGEGRTARLSDFSVLSKVWASVQVEKAEEASAYPQLTVQGDGRGGEGVKRAFSLSFW